MQNTRFENWRWFGYAIRNHGRRSKAFPTEIQSGSLIGQSPSEPVIVAASTRPMNCPETQAYLSGYLDEELPRSQRVSLCAHVAVCSHCRQALHQLAEAKASAARLVVPQLSASEWESLEAQMNLRIASEPGWSKPRI
jgi:hypothetical protein